MITILSLPPKRKLDDTIRNPVALVANNIVTVEREYHSWLKVTLIGGVEVSITDDEYDRLLKSNGVIPIFIE